MNRKQGLLALFILTTGTLGAPQWGFLGSTVGKTADNLATLGAGYADNVISAAANSANRAASLAVTKAPVIRTVPVVKPVSVKPAVLKVQSLPVSGGVSNGQLYSQLSFLLSGKPKMTAISKRVKPAGVKPVKAPTKAVVKAPAKKVPAKTPAKGNPKKINCKRNPNACTPQNIPTDVKAFTKGDEIGKGDTAQVFEASIGDSLKKDYVIKLYKDTTPNSRKMFNNEVATLKAKGQLVAFQDKKAFIIVQPKVEGKLLTDVIKGTTNPAKLKALKSDFVNALEDFQKQTKHVQ